MRAPAANDDDARLQILFHSLFLFTLSLSLSLVSSPLSILVVVRNPDTRLKFRHNRRTASNRKHHPPLKPPSATISLSNSPKTTNPERKTAPAPKTSHPQTRSSPFLLNLSLSLSLSLWAVTPALWDRRWAIFSVPGRCSCALLISGAAIQHQTDSSRSTSSNLQPSQRRRKRGLSGEAGRRSSRALPHPSVAAPTAAAAVAADAMIGVTDPKQKGTVIARTASSS